MPDWVLGDVLVETSNTDLEDEHFFEGVDALALDDARAILTGQGGWAVVDMELGEVLRVRAGERGYDLAYDPSLQRVWIGTRYSTVYCLDVSDPDDIVQGSCGIAGPPGGAYEDLAADEGYALLASHGQGARLYDQVGEYLLTLDDGDASGVGLVGDRAVVASGEALVLWDLSDRGSPVELDRADLPGTGGDVAFDGARVLVGLGAEGVAVFDLAGDALTDRGHYAVQGSTNAVALDGDYAYSASWTGYEVAWVGEGGPLVLGHEDAEQLAFGIAASGGNVATADWFHARTFRHEPGVAGPEIDAPPYVYFTEADASEALTLANGGAMDLSVSLTTGSGYALAPDSLTLAPGETGVVVVTADGQPAEDTIVLSTNDPDEPELEVLATWGQTLLGAEAADFELSGFRWPDKSTDAYRLSDYAGQVVFLSFWAEY